MTHEEAKTLHNGDRVYVAGQPDEYRFLRLDEDGDIIVANPHGGPTDMAFLKDYCHKVQS